MNEKRRASIISRDQSPDNAYRLERLSDEERSEVLFLRSAIPHCKHIAYLFKSSSDSELNLDRSIFIHVIQELQLAICFLFEKDVSSLIGYHTIEDDPIVRRQKLFRDTGLLAAIVEVLY